MGLFSKPEVIILKESSDAKKYLEELEGLLPKASVNVKKKIQKEIEITKAGIVGEDNILFELKNSGMDMVVLHDLYIETEDGLNAQIDFFVITKKLIFIIECKNLFGNIEIDSKGNFIRTMEYSGQKHKEGIYSPITQNERHLNVIRNKILENKNKVATAIVKGTFSDTYKSLVVLANPKTILNDKYAKKEIKSQVHRADQLVRVMKEMNAKSNELSYNLKEIKEIGEKWLARNADERKDYIQKYRNLIQEVERNEITISLTDQTSVEKICPRCGAPLILRTANRGKNIGNQFYGCSRFPKCRYIEQME